MAMYKWRCVISIQYIYMGMVATARDYSRSSLLFSLPSYSTGTLALLPSTKAAQLAGTNQGDTRQEKQIKPNLKNSKL